MGLKNPSSHCPPSDICQGIRGYHHGDVEHGSDIPFDSLHKIFRKAEFSNEEHGLGDVAS